MFETITEGAKNDGIRGVIHRHFGPVVDAEMARDGVRAVARLLIAVSLFSLVVGLLIGNRGVLVEALFAGILSVAFYFTHGRVIAVILLVDFAANAILNPGILSILWALFAVRGAQLAFGYRRCLKAEAQVAEGVQIFD